MTEVADVIQDCLSFGSIKASKEQWKMINALLACQTERLGGHLYRCTNCNKDIPVYNSCRNRHCPKCQGGEIATWLEQREKELVNSPYFHIVFTIPHELNGIALQNKQIIYDILFKAASKTLQDVACTKLGGKIGFFAVLHSWGQKLEAHPHLHCVVPGVVKKPDGTIKKTSTKYFLPDKILKEVFRAIFLNFLAKVKCELVFYGDQAYLQDECNFKSLLIKLAKKTWIVYPKKTFKHPALVLKYLARYTHRVAISNSRIVALKNHSVAFKYKDYKDDNKHKTCILSSSEFVRRFLLHVLPPGFTRIRYFGLLASSNKAKNLAHMENALGRAKAIDLKSHMPTCPYCGAKHFTHIQKLKPKKSLIPHCIHRAMRNLPLVA